MMIDDIVEGETIERGPFTLEADGAPVDLTGMTIALVLRAKDGTLVETAGDTRIDDDPATGRVYWTPDATDLSWQQSPYSLHWQVTDSDGKVVFFPSGDAARIAVYRA